MNKMHLSKALDNSKVYSDAENTSKTCVTQTRLRKIWIERLSVTGNRH